MTGTSGMDESSRSVSCPTPCEFAAALSAERARLRSDLAVVERSRDAWMDRCLVIELAARRLIDDGPEGPPSARENLAAVLRQR